MAIFGHLTSLMKKSNPFFWSVQSYLQSEMFLSNSVDIMKNLPRGGGCVSNLEYQEFRTSGKAYDFYSDADLGQLHLPNNTFVSR